MEFDGFDWDEGNYVKCQKHGVSIAEIESLFRGTPLVGPDAAHSDRERRFLAIGPSKTGRHVFAAFTWRERDGDRLIRVVSARFMHKTEVETYDEAASRSEK